MKIDSIIYTQPNRIIVSSTNQKHLNFLRPLYFYLTKMLNHLIFIQLFLILYEKKELQCIYFLVSFIIMLIQLTVLILYFIIP